MATRAIHVQARVHRLWDELAGFGHAETESALTHLLATLAELVEAQNAWWLAAVRVACAGADDPLKSWRAGAIRYLHESPCDRAFFKQARVLLEVGAIDESTQANMRGVGTFRVNALHDIVSPAWFDSPFYHVAYKARGIHDAIFVGCPVSDQAECIFGFHRQGERPSRFHARDRETLAYALRGLRWFQRRILLDRGLLLARQPLTETERRVLHSLLTGVAERLIALRLGLAPPTTHNHITTIYRKFGVNSRAELMALWLGQGA
jgi:DNA-binding CsgD family transcriptional regulator